MKTLKSIWAKFTHYLNVVITPVWKAMPAISVVLILILLFFTLKTGKSTNEKVEQAIPPNYPIKFDTPQNVLREPPLFHLDETIDVEARFLNTSDEVVTLQADVHWILITSTGSQIEPIEVGLFLTLKRGCTKIPFSNRRPDAVDILTRELFAKGHDKVTWKLMGSNRLIAPTLGGVQPFEVDEFSFIPDNVPISDNKVEQIPETCEGL